MWYALFGVTQLTMVSLKVYINNSSFILDKGFQWKYRLLVLETSNNNLFKISYEKILFFKTQSNIPYGGISEKLDYLYRTGLVNLKMNIYWSLAITLHSYNGRASSLLYYSTKHTKRRLKENHITIIYTRYIKFILVLLVVDMIYFKKKNNKHVMLYQICDVIP